MSCVTYQRAHKGNVENLVCVVTQDLEVNQDKMVNLVLLETVVKLDLKDHKGSRVLVDSEEKMVNLVHQDNVVNQDCLDQMVCRCQSSISYLSQISGTLFHKYYSLT